MRISRLCIPKACPCVSCSFLPTVSPIPATSRIFCEPVSLVIIIFGTTGFRGTHGRIPCKSLLTVFPYLHFYLFRHFRVFPEELLGVFPPLAYPLAVVGKPCPALVYDVHADAH